VQVEIARVCFQIRSTHWQLVSSGCVTSAETILINAQSVSEFVAHLNGEHAVVVTISPQSTASMAARHNLSLLSVRRVVMSRC
jgi:iron only hydrogenase large subunit-like protein